MSNEEVTIIQPKRPWRSLGTAFFTLAMALILFSSDYLDIAIGLLATFCLLSSLVFFWLTDKVYLTLKMGDEKIKMTGYFSIKELIFKHSEIEGYELNKDISDSGVIYDRVDLKTKNGDTFILQQKIYGDYQNLTHVISEKYKLINR